MEFETFILKNGIKVVHSHRTDSIIGHLGIILNVGSRDELATEHGIAHFIEHCFFKGTKKRKFYHILNRLDSVGGEIDAFTGKEETCVYASFMNTYYDRALELLSDIVFNSIFPEKEIVKEKEVIIDEIYSYLDNPYEQIYDDFENLVFKNHPIGKSILGTEKHLRSFNKKNIQDFIDRNYSTDRIVISSVGNIDSKKLRKLLEKYLEKFPLEPKSLERIPFRNYSASIKEIKKDTNQVHLALGTKAYDGKHINTNALALLNNVLGGPGMNSKLNMNIREKYGFTYHIESNYTIYSDVGMFYIYAGTDKKHLDKTRKLIYKELNNTKSKKFSPVQLHRAKHQLIGQLAISRENKCNQMLAYGKSLSLYDHIDTIEKKHQKIDKITSQEIFDTANEIFEPSNFSELSYI